MSARRGERYSEGAIEMIRKLAGEGRTDEEIALALGRPDLGFIGRIRRREGIPSGQRRRYSPDEDATIREAVAAGRTSRAIAEATGRTEYSIQNRRSTELVEAPHRGPSQIAAEARRDAHITVLLERRAARRAAEKEGAEV